MLAKEKTELSRGLLLAYFPCVPLESVNSPRQIKLLLYQGKIIAGRSVYPGCCDQNVKSDGTCTAFQCLRALCTFPRDSLIKDLFQLVLCIQSDMYVTVNKILAWVELQTLHYAWIRRDLNLMTLDGVDTFFCFVINKKQRWRKFKKGRTTLTSWLFKLITLKPR